MTSIDDLAVDAYLYGYPIVENLAQVRRYVTTGVGANPAADWNTFSHARRLADPTDTFVTINNDTIYSMASLDLSVGPVGLTVPATGDRYFVLQFVDAWTNNFAHVGRRSAGGGGGTYLIVPPGWSGAADAGTTLIEAPTRIVSIVGRFACDGSDDVAAVTDLQDRTLLQPVDATAAPTGLPEVTSAPEQAAFYEQVRTCIAAFPPGPREQEYQSRYEPLGILQSSSPYSSATPDLLDALARGEAAGTDKLEYLTHHGMSKVVNGWTVGIHMFDYNSEDLGFGTINDPAWIIADPVTAHVERAVADRLGLWGNHGYEAVYAQVFADQDGQPLSGDHRYEIAFEHDPPVGAFWSVMMHDIPRYYLVDNPINRYSIGDRTAGLQRGRDGSLTVTIQRDAPDEPQARANWLPAPDAHFRMVLRMYQPDESVIDGTYHLPPVVRRTG